MKADFEPHLILSSLMHARSSIILTIIGALSFGFVFHSDDERGGLRKTADDSDRNYTTIGSVALTVTNFGTLGTRNNYWPEQPSCEYPRGSRIEHLYQGGLWVGAELRSSNPLRDGVRVVSTGSHDGVSTTSGKGFEFTSLAGSSVVQRSSLSDSRFFDLNAISHQDFVSEYNDFVPRDSTEPDRSTPMFLRVKQESYAWNFPFADFFVILNYTIFNAGRDTLDSVYVGMWNNTVVRNTNNVRPGTSGYFNQGAHGYSDSLRMLYSFDWDGIPTPPAADSYVGMKLLGTFPFPRGVDSVGNLKNRTFVNSWIFRSTSGQPEYFSPQDDAANLGGARSRYDRLSASMSPAQVAALRVPRPSGIAPSNSTILLSTGPFQTLLPGDSLQVVFAIVCARKFGTQAANLDTREQRRTLYTNASFAQQAYDGEDVNGNNIADPGEDINGNNRLDHFQLPQPPRSPKVKAVVENQKVSMYWDRASAENSIDPITRQRDFEGYKIFRSNAGADFTNPEDLLLTLSLVGEFDIPTNRIGYNTGFGRIALPQARRFPDDTVDYWYKFPPEGESVTHLNGWQYLYGVAAFDRGDSAAGVTSLQSKTEIRRVIPGTNATPARNADVGVYPNPYYANATWDGGNERTRKMYFYNLPARCEIRVYTLAGDVVANIQHDGATYDGSDIEWFRRFGGSQTTPQFSGGEHAWDLITKFDQAIATGLYLFSVTNNDNGEVKTGKFLVIK